MSRIVDVDGGHLHQCYLVEEASEAMLGIYTSLEEAIEDAKAQHGKYLVTDEEDNVLFDSQPNVSYKI